MSDTPIIVPVSAPGASEAAAQARVFSKTIADVAMAHEKNVAATLKAAAATKEETHVVGQSTQAHQHHTRTLAEETARLKAHHEQLVITRQAQKALGESVNATDLGKMRTFVRRSLGGGVIGEAGRGVVEGIEGFQGAGLAGGLGMAGAGIAAFSVIAEGVSKIYEHIGEEAKNELRMRSEMVDQVMSVQKRMSQLGSEGISENGIAMQQLSKFGEGAVTAGQKYATDNHDQSGVNAYSRAMNLSNGDSGKAASIMEGARDYADLSGMTIDAALNALPNGAIQELMRGANPIGIAGEMSRLPGQGGIDNKVTAAQLATIRGSKTFKDLQAARDAEAKRNQLKIDHMGDAPINTMNQNAADLAPMVAKELDTNAERWGQHTDITNDFDKYNKTVDVLSNPWFQTFLSPIPNAVFQGVDWLQGLTGRGAVTPFNKMNKDDMERSNNFKLLGELAKRLHDVSISLSQNHSSPQPHPNTPHL